MSETKTKTVQINHATDLYHALPQEDQNLLAKFMDTVVEIIADGHKTIEAQKTVIAQLTEEIDRLAAEINALLKLVGTGDRRSRSATPGGS